MPVVGQKPPRGAGRLRRDHALSRGLVSFIPFNEGSGGWVRDLAQPGLYSEMWSGSSVNYGAGVWTASQVGHGLRLTRSNTEFLSFEKRGLPLYDWAGKSFSWLVVHQPVAVTNDTTLLGFGEPTGGTRNIIALAFRLDGQMISVTFYNDDADFFLPSSQYMVPGRVYAHAATYDATSQRMDLYQNGMLISGQTMGGNVTSSDKKMRIGRRTDNGWDTYDGVLIAVLMWDRKLSHNDIAVISSDPFQLIRPGLIIVPTTPTIQYARPDSDVSRGSWTTQSGGTTNLWDTINEASPANDSDYVRSSQSPGSADVLELTLTDVLDPLSSADHVLRYRYGKDVAGDRIDLTVRLMQGATQIAAWTHNDISTTLTDAEQTLTSLQADAITDYSNLRLKFEAVKV